MGVLRPREKPLFCAAPAGWFKGFLTFRLWKLLRAEATPGLRKQRGVEAFHTEGVGLFPMEKVYVAQPPPPPHLTPPHPNPPPAGGVRVDTILSCPWKIQRGVHDLGCLVKEF